MFRANRMRELRNICACPQRCMGTLSQPRCSFRERNDPSRLHPCFQNVSDDLLQGCFQLRETIAQKQTKVDALGAVVELALVNGQAGRSRKRLRQTVRVKEIIQVITDAFAQRFNDPRVAGQSVDLGQCFHHETCMEMINEVTHTIDGIKPGAVRILILQNEIQISFCNSPVIFVGKNLGSAGQQEGAISGGVNDSPSSKGV